MHVTLIKYFIHLFILKADLLLPSSCINVQATFKSGLTAVLNRQNFEWNHSNFNKLFQETDDAYDFVMIFREVTQYDSERGYYVPKPESAIQTTSTACDDEIDENDEVNDEEEINPPARKRTNLEESNDELPAKATKSSHHLHSNPLDDSILNKKIGKCISLACSLSACLHSILVVAYCSKDTINS